MSEIFTVTAMAEQANNNGTYVEQLSSKLQSNFLARRTKCVAEVPYSAAFDVPAWFPPFKATSQADSDSVGSPC